MSNMLRVPQNLPENIQRVRERIRAAAARRGRECRLRHTAGGQQEAAAESIRARRAGGVEHFGESYVQEALPKIETLRGLELTWHFIGQLQAQQDPAGRRELRLGARRGPPAHRPAPVGAAALSRAAAECVPAGERRRRSDQGRRRARRSCRRWRAAVAVLPRLALRGLMCIPPPEDDPDRQRHWFAADGATLMRSPARPGHYARHACPWA